jgi:hypothetical protein
MQNTRMRIAAVAVVVAAAGTIPSVGLAGQPVVRDHESVVEGPFPSSFCGVDGSEVDTGTFTFRQDASGAFHSTESFRNVFTASSTGKSLEYSNANLDMGAGVDNGDGTVTFSEHTAGLVLKFKILNGPVLKDADGKPLIGAGVIDSVATFDIATGDLISLQETVHGPHPFRDGVDVCGPSIAYLTS